jgi:hypothetical protein
MKSPQGKPPHSPVSFLSSETLPAKLADKLNSVVDGNGLTIFGTSETTSMILKATQLSFHD